MIILTKESSGLLKKKMPQKLKDLRCFLIPCMMSETCFDNALCDLVASMNIMLHSLFKKLNIGEVKPMKILLQLAGRLISHPKGIIEDVFIKVKNFIFPVDFVVLGKEDDRGILLILERSILENCTYYIDMDIGKQIIRVRDESIEFNFCNKVKYTPKVKNARAIKTIDELVEETKKEDNLYPSFEEYEEKVNRKEDDKKNKMLNKNEIYLKKHLIFKAEQVDIKKVNMENYKSK